MPITTHELQNLHHSARILERRGVDGYEEIENKFGEVIAKSVLVMYLRALNGSLRQGEANKEVPLNVRAALRDCGLLQDEQAVEEKNNALATIKEQAATYVAQQEGEENRVIIPRMRRRRPEEDNTMNEIERLISQLQDERKSDG